MERWAGKIYKEWVHAGGWADRSGQGADNVAVELGRRIGKRNERVGMGR